MNFKEMRSFLMCRPYVNPVNVILSICIIPSAAELNPGRSARSAVKNMTDLHRLR
jgi:hypothetical protein